MIYDHFAVLRQTNRLHPKTFIIIYTAIKKLSIHEKYSLKLCRNKNLTATLYIKDRISSL